MVEASANHDRVGMQQAFMTSQSPQAIMEGSELLTQNEGLKYHQPNLSRFGSRTLAVLSLSRSVQGLPLTAFVCALQGFGYLSFFYIGWLSLEVIVVY